MSISHLISVYRIRGICIVRKLSPLQKDFPLYSHVQTQNMVLKSKKCIK